MFYSRKRLLVFLIAALMLQAGAASAQTGVDLIRPAAGRSGGSGDEMVEEKQALFFAENPLWLEQAVDPDDYILGPNDHLLINIVGPQPRSFSLPILPEGYVFFPGIGGIHADGLTMTEFRKRLGDEVGRVFKNVKVYCYLQRPRVFRVFVTGEVANPGAVDVSAVQRVSDAIELAGSIKGLGSNRRVRLERGQGTVHVDILGFVLSGDFSDNPFLSNGDRIHVPVATMHATIRGRVNRSASYEILDGETVADLIELGGGFKGEAITERVILSRLGTDGSVSTAMVPEDRYAFTELRDRDEVIVMDGMTGTSRVYVFGATEKTGHYFITEGEGLTGLLARIGGFSPDADLGAASIERRDGSIIRIDLKDFIPPDPTDEMKLEDGDILHIPSISKMVAVGGEVKLPGKFAYEGNWTVAQYIGLAGGPTEEGSVDRVMIYSPDGGVRKGNGDTRPNRGDVIIVKRSRSSILGGFFGSLVTLGTVVVSIIVLTN